MAYLVVIFFYHFYHKFILFEYILLISFLQNFNSYKYTKIFLYLTPNIIHNYLFPPIKSTVSFPCPIAQDC